MSPAHKAPLALRVGALAVLFATGSLVLLGSTVRVTESGMGCSSWPLCNGQIGPIAQFHPLLEQSHRYLAALVSIGVVALYVAARRSGPPAFRRWTAIGTATIVLQVPLGALTVFAHNAPPTVAAHLLGGLALLAATALAAAASFGLLDDRVGRLRKLDAVAITMTALLLVSGTVVADGGAAGVCPSWPWCAAHPGAPWHLVTLQLVHRTMAGLTALVLLAAASARLRGSARPTSERRLCWGLVALLGAQVAAGALDTLLRAPDALQDVHIGLAGALWCLAAIIFVGRAGTPIAAPSSDDQLALGAPGTESLRSGALMGSGSPITGR